MARKSIENMLQELHDIDKQNRFCFRFLGGTCWEVREIASGEGLHTDAGFSDVKKWILKRL